MLGLQVYKAMKNKKCKSKNSDIAYKERREIE